MTPPEAHAPYFELKEACGQPGCPICRLSATRVAARIDNLLWEHVSDVDFRADFRKAGGFCGEHSRDLENYRDGQAVAILHRDILEDHLKALAKGKGHTGKGRCPICMDREKIEKNFLTVLADADGPLQEAFRASEGLCVPHFRFATERLKPPKWLQEWQVGRLRDLLSRTERFIDFSSFGREADFKNLSETDRTVWKELARTLRGWDAPPT